MTLSTSKCYAAITPILEHFHHRPKKPPCTLSLSSTLKENIRIKPLNLGSLPPVLQPDEFTALWKALPVQIRPCHPDH